MEQTFFIAGNKFVAFVAFVGSSSLARAISLVHQPDVEQQIQTAHYPQGKGPDSMQCEGLLDSTDNPKGETLIPVQDPVQRFAAAMAQVQLSDADATLAALETGGAINNTNDRKIAPAYHAHFTPQVAWLKGDPIRLYKFPDHLEQLANDAGLAWPLPVINEAKNPQPTLTPEQEARVLAYYAADKALVDNITEPGQIYTAPPEPETPKPVPQTVTPRQFRLAMLGGGIMPEQITQWLEQLPEPQRSGALIEWEYALDIKRDHPLLVAFGLAMNKSDEDIDNLFRTAGGL